jgi:hypothetical protein
MDHNCKNRYVLSWPKIIFSFKEVLLRCSYEQDSNPCFDSRKEQKKEEKKEKKGKEYSPCLHNL